MHWKAIHPMTRRIGITELQTWTMSTGLMKPRSPASRRRARVTTMYILVLNCRGAHRCFENGYLFTRMLTTRLELQTFPFCRVPGIS